MADKINLAVIGCGGIAKNALVPYAAAINEFKLYAFSDVVEDKAKALCAEFGGEYATTDVDKIFADPRVDAVVICTLPDTHASLGQAALAEGKHAFIQKPAAVTYGQCRALVEAERASKAKAMVAYCYRLSPLTNRVREVMRPKAMMARMMPHNVAKSHAHYLANPGAGAPMLELACHNVDMVYWMAGAKPARVSAFGGALSNPGMDIVDNFVMNVEFENGVVAAVVSVDCGANDFSRKWFAEFYGEGVTAIIDGFKKLLILGKQQDTMEVEYQTGIGIDRDMAVFRDCIVNGAPSQIPAAEGVVATVTMLKAFESLKSGRAEAINWADYGL